MLTLLLGMSSFAGFAQTADEAWLRAAPEGTVLIPIAVRALGTGTLERTAVAELRRNLGHMAGKSALGPGITAHARLALGGETVVGTVDEVSKAFPDAAVPHDLKPEGYWIYSNGEQGDKQRLIVAGADEAGVLYGAFAVLRGPDTGEISGLHDHPLRSHPAMRIRWVDEWDNADGSIERGYAGRSIFVEGGKVRDELAPVAEYARLLASVGINGCNVNNVNNAGAFLAPEMLRGLARVASAMRPWGVRLALSVDIASPQKIGGLATYDPLDPAVKAWWAAKVSEIYALIPDFAGFTVKADSEGQPGPASYGRTPADAANLLAGALQPHGGVVLYRAFVYNHHLDWKDPKADRARAAYDIFHPLDGKFAANVIVQTKEGPIDFQAREPVSPLFGGLTQTNQAMEVQITQEYTGQQRHLVYLAPMWKQVLDFDMHADGVSTPVKRILAGTAFKRSLGGMVGVAGVGRDAWLGSPLAMSNLYAFGRLAWDPNLAPEEIAEEWTRQTMNNDPEVLRTVTNMLMQSWPAYEHYTGPLGMQTLTDITGSHYGPNIESSENNGWGQWHRADHEGVGFDRSVATGTGFAGQYPPQVAKEYEFTATTPDELLLFFHHVPYGYKLHDGKTVIQDIYDSHYRGAAEAAELGNEWATLRGRVDAKLYNDVRARLEYQAGHAIVWRDAIVQYFLKLSGIVDEHGRAGHYPGRLEAEEAKLTGYKVIDVTPWEDASGGKAVSCGEATCSAEWTYKGAAGRFDIAVEYFDLQGGTAKFTLLVEGKPAASWSADAALPSRHPHGDNSIRHLAQGVELRSGDTLRVQGVPDGADPSPLDYIEIVPAQHD
jgi:alpha-glucuronidase